MRCMVPVILGSSISDAEALLPPNSFIHVDNFTSPLELANWLRYLDHNDTAYR